MNKYDTVVVGSGIAGMALSLLFAGNGERVLLLEKADRIGGSMQRFKRKGIPFDTGFHFTAGFSSCMGEMLDVLNLRHGLKEIPVSTHILFTESSKHFEFPRGQGAVCDYLCERFPFHAEKIRRYFMDERHIFANTPLFSLEAGHDSFSDMVFQDEDVITLKDYIAKLDVPDELGSLLMSFITCHGGRPDEISLADHCRVSFGLMDDMVRLDGSGESIIDNFKSEVQRLGIEIRTHCTIDEFLEISRKQSHKMRLTDASVISFERCIMAIHPLEIMRLMPVECMTEDFKNRISEFNETCGFFTVFAVMKGLHEEIADGLYSVFTTDKIEDILDSNNASATATGIMINTEKKARTITAFRTVFPEETKSWEGSVSGARSDAYLAYKRKKSAEIEKHLVKVFPSLEGEIEMLDSASLLTYRNYLSPTGSAYGIRTCINQHKIFGKLPLRNCYTAGQNALLPGAMGALLSAFVIFRKIIGQEKYMNFLSAHTQKK